MSPFVKAGFGSVDGEGAITVGNKSFPTRPHEAIIKSFEYSMSNGIQCRIEIFDEQGGSFTRFFEEMAKCIDTISTDYSLRVEFGWIGTRCDGSVDVWPSPTLQFLIKDVEATFNQGKIKFTVTATDMMQPIFNARENKCSGGDKVMSLPLKQAIIKLFTEEEPICDVKFLKRNFNGPSTEQWEFYQFGMDGPTDAWRSDNQNKLATAIKWLEPFRTKDEKGIIATFNSTENQVIFWEDFTLDCDEPTELDARSIGTFIVNGGKCSCVLDFSPKINWVLAWSQLATGGQTSPSSHKPVKKNNKRPAGCKVQQQEDESKAGPMQAIPITSQGHNNWGPEEVTPQTDKSQNAHAKANSLMEAFKAIEAELRIVGNPDPDFTDLKLIVGRTASIVVINPFHLVGGGDDACPEYLADPPCNEYLSNKNWMIKGANHNITEGSYTTTLNVVLMVPGIDLDPDSTLGADPDAPKVKTC
jgi:hypothetical protein